MATDCKKGPGGLYSASARWLPPIRIAGGAPFEGDASHGFGIDRIRLDGASEGTAAEIHTLVLPRLLVKRVAVKSRYFEFEVAGRVRIWRIDNGLGEADDGRQVFPIRDGAGGVAARGTTRSLTARGGAGWMVDIHEDALLAAAEQMTDRVLPRTLPLTRPLDPAGSERFAKALSALESVFSPSVHPGARARGLHETEALLLDAMITGPLRPVLEPFLPYGAGPSSATAVRHAVDLVRGRSREPLTLAEMAAAAGIGGRALQIAFRRHLGCSPLAYLRMVRLADAHRLLSGGLVATVTDAAMQVGFWHLGEFAVAYRQRYGESPSTTLRRR